jgi:hypothetical protein
VDQPADLSAGGRGAGGEPAIGRAEIERFARIRIPASATALRSYYTASMDTTVYVGLRLPRGAVRTFVRDGHFKDRLQPGNRTLLDPEGKELGWRLTGPAKVAGLEEIQAGLGRNLMVVYDNPRRPAVYLAVTTL